MAPPVVTIREISAHEDQEVELRGWLYNKRSSGKLHFLQIRDGTGVIQAVVFKNDVPAEQFTRADHLGQETALIVRGLVKKDARSPIGYELSVKHLEVVSEAKDYPITPKEHGVAYLMEHRHLWLRSARQNVILRVRATVVKAIRDYFDGNGFTLVDAPIFTPAACEGTSTLFTVPYFDLGNAYLTQSGQLYMEAAAAALGKVYCFGPTFRAEKSKTRRHLMEFWMVEPEVAFLEFAGLCDLTQEFVVYLAGRVLDRNREELKILERDTAKLETILPPFPRITYTEAIEILQKAGNPIQWGDDFGGDEETILASQYDRPVMVTKFPAAFKAFYMQPDPDNPDIVLGLDLLAPEGYGEIIGGSQRIHDHDLLLERIRQHDLPVEAFQWYLDVRKYGAYPHSGFGMGIERFVAWMTGLTHLRETIPYPRMLYKIYP